MKPDLDVATEGEGGETRTIDKGLTRDRQGLNKERGVYEEGRPRADEVWEGR